MPAKLPKLPNLLDRKISKTGQTRGADDDVIYQNRVNRNNTVLIPFQQWIQSQELRKNALKGTFEKGFIVMVSPKDYFDCAEPNMLLQKYHLTLGENCFIF